MLLSQTTGDETIRYYYDSDGAVTELGYQKGDEAERYYFFARNGWGDVIALYRSTDSALIGIYEYDAYVENRSWTEAGRLQRGDNVL